MIIDVTQRTGGSGESKITQIDVVAATTGEVLRIPVTLPEQYLLLVEIDEIPEPDTTLYWGIHKFSLVFTIPYTTSSIYNGNFNESGILRPNGTIGTDANWAKVSGGNVVIGDSTYGKVRAGSTYHIIIADIGG